MSGIFEAIIGAARPARDECDCGKRTASGSIELMHSVIAELDQGRQQDVFERGAVLAHRFPEAAPVSNPHEPMTFLEYLDEPLSLLDHPSVDPSTAAASQCFDCIISYVRHGKFLTTLSDSHQYRLWTDADDKAALEREAVAEVQRAAQGDEGTGAEARH